MAESERNARHQAAVKASRSVETAWMKERKDYIKKHNLHRVLGNVMDSCLCKPGDELPENPTLFLAESILRMFLQDNQDPAARAKLKTPNSMKSLKGLHKTLTTLLTEVTGEAPVHSPCPSPTKATAEASPREEQTTEPPQTKPKLEISAATMSPKVVEEEVGHADEHEAREAAQDNESQAQAQEAVPDTMEPQDEEPKREEEIPKETAKEPEEDAKQEETEEEKAQEAAEEEEEEVPVAEAEVQEDKETVEVEAQDDKVDKAEDEIQNKVDSIAEEAEEEEPQEAAAAEEAKVEEAVKEEVQESASAEVEEAKEADVKVEGPKEEEGKEAEGADEAKEEKEDEKEVESQPAVKEQEPEEAAAVEVSPKAASPTTDSESVKEQEQAAPTPEPADVEVPKEDLMVSPQEEKVEEKAAAPRQRRSSPKLGSDVVASDWEEVRTSDGKTFWYNTKQKEKTWEKPTEVAACDNSSKDWCEVTSNDGSSVWYYNTRTGMKQWHKPDALQNTKVAGSVADRQSTMPSHPKEVATEKKDKTIVAKKVLSETWTMYQPEEGPSYFINAATGVKQWNKPEEFMDPQIKGHDWLEYDYEGLPYYVNNKLNERTWNKQYVLDLMKQGGSAIASKQKAVTNPDSKVDIGNGWVQYTTKDDRKFYVNTKTKQKSWSHPDQATAGSKTASPPPASAAIASPIEK